jgi:CO/xanthine dehydrogenase Mo-binding subunit
MTLVGTNVPMVGAQAKVTGAVNYAANLEFPGQLYAKALRSPYVHAKLIHIDASKAAVLPGVRAVVTREDLIGLHPYFGTGVEDQPVVVIDKVRYAGDIVAAVAADSRETAEEAVTLIEAEYEELPAVTAILEAANRDAPVIHSSTSTKLPAAISTAFIAQAAVTSSRAFANRTKLSKTLIPCRRSSTAISNRTP